MKKLLLLLCTLLGTAGAWAVTNVTVIDKAQDATTYGTLSGTTFTTNAASGMADVTIDGIIGTTATSFSYGACLALTSTSSGTITMTAPQGYVIMGYTLTARSNTYSVPYTLTPSAGGSAVSTTTGGVTLSASGLDAQTASFTYSAASANSFYVPAMTITVGTAAEVETYQAQLAAYEKAQAFPELIMTAQTKYMSSTNQWTSDAADSSEGWLDRLTDGNLTNYFHSDWHGSYTGGTHYIEATLPNAVNTLHLYYVTRSTGTGCPTQITVSGSDDGTTWTDNIASITSNMPIGASKTFFSEALTFANSYSHLRFYVPQTNSTTNGWFCLAEANLYSANATTAEAMTLASISAVNLTSEQIARINAVDTELRSTVVNVTYELYESDGTTLVTSTTVEQLKNSAINVPSSWTSSPLYSYSTVGTIGTSNCTIKVIRTLIGVLTTANLSNSKCYTIRTYDRGWWVVPANGTQATSTTKASLATSETDLKQQFAFISYENNFYLYSVSEKKFISKSGSYTTLTATPGDNVTLLASSGNNDYPTVIAFQDGAYQGGISNGYTPAVITSWNDLSDGGNRAAIIEAAAFDATEALAALEAYFHPANSYSRVEAEILPYIFENPADIFNSDPAPSIGKPFGISAAAAQQFITTYGTQLTAQQFSEEEYNAAKAILNTSIVYPEDGKFYLVKNTYNNKYLRVAQHGTRGQVFADLTAEEAAQNASSRIFVRYIDGKPYMLSQGYYFNWVYSNYSGYEAYTTEEKSSDKYAHFVCVGPGVGAFSIALGNGEGTYAYGLNPGFYALLNGTTTVAGSTTDHTNEYAQWTFEEVQTEADGDVNMDGETTVDDVADLVAYLLGTVPAGMSVNQNAADFDGNGVITLRNITLLVNKIKNAQ